MDNNGQIVQKCLWCGNNGFLDNNSKKSDFDKNEFIKNGFNPICKKCKDKITDLETFKTYLQDSCIKFDKSTWNKATEEIKNRASKQYENGIPDDFLKISFKKIMGKFFSLGNLFGDYAFSPLKKNEKNINNNSITEVSEDLIEKWGEGYKYEEYLLFEKKYNRLTRSYKEKTEMHSEMLLVYIRYRVKEELATAAGDVKEAKQWGELASKAAQDAKINPSQMSKSDISGGIDVISQLFEAVESEVGIIPLLPKLLEQPYDDADMIIWSIINYIRRLEEKPTVTYRDIYKFYDEMLNEHYKQNGYNDEQIKEYLRKRNNVFRDLEEIYIEPLYSKDVLDEDGDE